jgi:predicted MFS family arabinose efflux permease
MMSLSTSGTYLGISAGAALGAWVFGLANITTVCLVGFALQVVALVCVVVSRSQDEAR